MITAGAVANDTLTGSTRTNGVRFLCQNLGSYLIRFIFAGELDRLDVSHDNLAKLSGGLKIGFGGSTSLELYLSLIKHNAFSLTGNVENESSCFLIDSDNAVWISGRMLFKDRFHGVHRGDCLAITCNIIVVPVG